MGRALHLGSIATVIGMGIPPWLELDAIPNPNQRSLASAFFLLAAAIGVWGAIRREPFGLRIATIAYGGSSLGLGLFATDRSLPYLLAYVTGLIAMNALVYHDRAFGPVLAAITQEDAVSRRTRLVVLRAVGSLAGALALAYGLSVALLPLFAIDVGSRDPVVALVLSLALVLVLLFLARLPERPSVRRGFSRDS
ncbi:MAG: hypothetical protein E6K18_00420 [Methanobacteriota archaeon]|nr:MAG: hypothetical protein E6K18_00420 [Euryarchaeota archaeon]